MPRRFICWCVSLRYSPTLRFRLRLLPQVAWRLREGRLGAPRAVVRRLRTQARHAEHLNALVEARQTSLREVLKTEKAKPMWEIAIEELAFTPADSSEISLHHADSAVVGRTTRIRIRLRDRYGNQNVEFENM